jgi:hypothetical protein
MSSGEVPSGETSSSELNSTGRVDLLLDELRPLRWRREAMAGLSSLAVVAQQGQKIEGGAWSTARGRHRGMRHRSFLGARHRGGGGRSRRGGGTEAVVEACTKAAADLVDEAAVLVMEADIGSEVGRRRWPLLDSGQGGRERRFGKGEMRLRGGDPRWIRSRRRARGGFFGQSQPCPGAKLDLSFSIMLHKHIGPAHAATRRTRIILNTDSGATRHM